MNDMDCSPVNILTLDIEDWSQSSPEVFDNPRTLPIPPPTIRAVANTRRLLKILQEHKTRATCFILGSLAEAYPSLISEIRDCGHEIASHGYYHFPVYRLKPDEFKADVAASLEHLERITGEKIKGYRAPYFSITGGTEWALRILADLGIEYDSSVFPLNRRYYRIPGWGGAQHAPRYPRLLGLGERRLLELPPTTVRIMGQNLPFAGGAFLRFLPISLFRQAIRFTNQNGYPGILYLHPHDLDNQHLRCSSFGTPFRKRLLRWGLNAGRGSNERKLRELLSEFSFTSVREWLDSNANQSLSRRAVSQAR